MEMPEEPGGIEPISEEAQRILDKQAKETLARKQKEFESRVGKSERTPN